MRQPLSLSSAVHLLGESFSAQVGRQLRAPGHRGHGGYVHQESGIDDPAHTGTGALVDAALALYCLPGPRQRDPGLLEVIDLAVDYWKRVQRPDGRIDLRSCNYDSGPDTAFVVEGLCPHIALARGRTAGDAALTRTLTNLESVARAMAAGLADGGFHTPNHRWVTTSAISQAMGLWPDLVPRLAAVREAYLAETPDIDDEGFFIERSIAVYDAVCDRSLLHIDTYRSWPAGRSAALANLSRVEDLFHPDGTAETGLSHRQDHGTRVVPGGLLPCYLLAARCTGEARWAARAAWMWDRGCTPGLADAARTALLLLDGAPLPTAAAPADVARFLPRNRLWRVRDGRFSLSVFGETTHLATLVCGDATLSQISAGQSYFGQGRFLPDTMSGDAQHAILRCAGKLWQHPPGYWQPLGSVVPKDDFTAALARRQQRPVPLSAARVEFRRMTQGVSVRYVSESGFDQVTAQLAFDFPAGAIWETADTCLKTAPGQVIFLRHGAGTMRFGTDAITLSGGADGHRTWQMRDVPPVPAGLCRIIVPLLSPFDHTVAITVRH